MSWIDKEIFDNSPNIPLSQNQFLDMQNNNNGGKLKDIIYRLKGLTGFKNKVSYETLACEQKIKIKDIIHDISNFAKKK